MSKKVNAGVVDLLIPSNLFHILSYRASNYGYLIRHVYTRLHPDMNRKLSEIVHCILIHAALSDTTYSDLEILHFALAPPEHP